jgi:hypothetical protein
VLELYSKSLKKSYIHMPKLSFHAQIMKWVWSFNSRDDPSTGDVYWTLNYNQWLWFDHKLNHSEI